jgi:CRISPR-associated protein Cas1
MRDRAAEFLNDLGLIPPSHRELFMSLEKAKVRVEDHRIVYWTSDGAKGAIEIAHSVPYCNIAFLLLGPGCSVSSEAMELLAAANVVVGFTGGGSTPLNAGVEPIAFASGQSEYRPTQYMQAWARWWFDDSARLAKGMQLLAWRAHLIEETWKSRSLQRIFQEHGIPALSAQEFFGSTAARQHATDDGTPRMKPAGLFGKATSSFTDAHAATADEYVQRQFTGGTVEQLLGQEGEHVKRLYQFLARRAGLMFKGRDPHGPDNVNKLLTMGNYVAYGLAATALHGLGISFSFAVLHGKTRRGALVFDIADPVKDALVAPIAFACARAGKDNDSCRKILKQALEDTKMLAKVMNYTKFLAN